jgi:integrase
MADTMPMRRNPTIHSLPDGSYEVRWSTERKPDQSARLDTQQEAQAVADRQRAAMDRDDRYRWKRVKRGIWTRPGANGRPMFQIVFRDADGRQRRETVNDHRITVAERKLREREHRRDRGERVTNDPRLTFNQAADMWWEMRAENLRPNTRASYRTSLNRDRHADGTLKPERARPGTGLRTYFGRQRLRQIGPGEIAKFINHRKAERAKGWTIRGDLTVISNVFKHAARHEGFAGPNPVAALDREERPTTEDAKPKRVLNSEEVDRLVAAVPDRYKLLFELAAKTGARIGETLGIVWGDVDLDSDIVGFTHQLDRNGNRVPLKTARSRRRVEIDPALAAKLRAAKLAAPASRDSALVFTTRNGTGHDRKNVGDVLERAVERAGLGSPVVIGQRWQQRTRNGAAAVVLRVAGDQVRVEVEGARQLDLTCATLRASHRLHTDRPEDMAPTFHSLRHAHGSELIAEGWDIEEVSARLGHANVQVTARIYVHEYDRARRSKSRKDRLAVMYARRRKTTNRDAVALPAR